MKSDEKDEARRAASANEVQNATLLRAEYGIPSAKDDGWRLRSRTSDQKNAELESKLHIERAIDPLELARREEVIAQARFFARLKLATRAGEVLVTETAKKAAPLLAGVAVVAVVGLSVVAIGIIGRQPLPNVQRQGEWGAMRQILRAIGVGVSAALVQTLKHRVLSRPVPSE